MGKGVCLPLQLFIHEDFRDDLRKDCPRCQGQGEACIAELAVSSLRRHEPEEDPATHEALSR